MRIRNFRFSISILLIRFIFCIVSPSWAGVWVGLEVNLFGAILFLVKSEKRALTRGFKYYFVQCFGSRVIIFRVVLGMWRGQQVIVRGLLCGLGIKLGAAPFHFWVVEVLDHIQPLCMWFILTVQKLVPFFCICHGFHGG